ncbi:SURF1 family protein [Rhodobacteraceae bacterium NNCM2]|nr:SURF1 family protein [Coraliihabitans acroporae]
MKPRIAIAITIGVVAVSVLTGLGVWQLQRLQWKQTLLDEIAARFEAAPVPLPGAPTEATDQFLQVALDGRLLEGELAVLTSRRPYGPGFKIVSPFELADGRRILVDRGFVPEDRKDPATRPAEPATTAEITGQTGTLFWPNETDSFTPAPDPARNMWFARDPAQMAEALGTLPILVSLNTRMTGEWPEPAPVAFNIPNNHLSYAMTWFALAIVWAGMTVIWLRAELRKERRKG